MSAGTHEDACEGSSGGDPLERACAERDEVRRALETAMAERDAARAELEEADQRRDEFLATLAHELRNPLAPIRSAIEIMRIAEGDYATAAAARAIIERQLKHLVHLIDDVVDVTRVTRGKLELRCEPVELARILELAIETNRPLLESKQQHVTLELASSGLVVQADSRRLAQVFSNLLNNAAKYSSPHAEIRIRTVREGPEAVVTVADSGIGIEGALLGRIFHLFAAHQWPQASPHNGLGVGLTLVRRLVELHGGTVCAASAGPGKGSCFTVRLALRQSGLSQHASEAASAPRPRRTPRARILVADDNYDAAQSLALMLGMDGHDVRTASDGVEALEVAEEFKPQVVILDIGMPRLDGYETARRLREQSWAHTALVFALTGRGQEDDRERTRRAGFDRHLVKPIDPEVLTQMLSQVLTNGNAHG
ncbi:MAG TPA: response regulator [Steroidobacteraceae bacterium]|nr:response regulator [Steroidobacteraceae bacterium]